LSEVRNAPHDNSVFLKEVRQLGQNSISNYQLRIAESALIEIARGCHWSRELMRAIQ